MRALVIGAGRVGRAVALDLARQPGIDAVKLADRDDQTLTEAGKYVEGLLARHRDPRQGPTRIEGAVLADDYDWAPLLEGHRVAVCCTPDEPGRDAVSQAGVQVGCHVVEVAGRSRPLERTLHEAAVASGVTVLLGSGLAPGLLSVLAGRAFELFRDRQKVHPRDRVTELELERRGAAAQGARRKDVALVLREIDLPAEDCGGDTTLHAESLIATLGEEAELVRLRSTVQGSVAGQPRVLHLELDVGADSELGLSALTRAASYPAAVAGYMLAAGAVGAVGVLQIEKAVALGPFVSAVRARGLDVREVWE